MTLVNSPYLSGAALNQANVNNQQHVIGAASQQLSTGGDAADYSDVADVKVFTDQQIALIENMGYQTSVNLQMERMKFTSSRLATLRDICADFQQQTSGLNSSTLASPAQFQTWCQDKLKQVTSILNSSFSGEYIFGGTATNVPPCIDLTTLPPLPVGAPTSSANYYVGSTNNMSFQSDDITTTVTPTRADDLGIAELITGLLLCVTLPPNQQQARLSQANDLALKASQDIINSNAGLDYEIVTLQQVSENLLGQQVDLEQSIQTIGYLSEAELLQRYLEEKTRVSLTQVVTTTNLNLTRDLIDRITV